MPSFVGLANLVDSLLVIKKLVFEESEITLKQLAEVLKSNYEGFDEIHERILNKVPKYGNDDDVPGLSL